MDEMKAEGCPSTLVEKICRKLDGATSPLDAHGGMIPRGAARGLGVRALEVGHGAHGGAVGRHAVGRERARVRRGGLLAVLRRLGPGRVALAFGLALRGLGGLAQLAGVQERALR